MTSDDHRKAAASPPPGPHTVLLLSLWLLAVATTTLGWRAQLDIRAAEQLRDRRIDPLQSDGWTHIRNRRWKEAEASFSAIEAIIPRSTLAQIGHAAARHGRIEEETQFLAYWTGQAIAELDAGRLEETEAAIRRITAVQPGHPEAASLASRVEQARIRHSIDAELASIRSLLSRRDWRQALDRAESLDRNHQDQPEISDILREARSGWERLQQDLSLAQTLLRQARQRDTGQFDPQALDWLREASTLDPANPDITAMLERMSSYTRTLRVPDDFPTPAEAISHSRPNDRILIGPGTWSGPLVVHHALHLQGQDPATTTFVCPPGAGSAITLKSGSSRLSGITFRHDSLLIGAGERFSAATLAGGSCEFVHCHFIQANGHGLAVIHGARATLRRCLFRDNAWNGLAALGRGSSIHAEECESTGNFHNGIECWDHAAATLLRNHIRGNSRNGIHIDQSDQPINCSQNILSENREFGICLTSAASGCIRHNQTRHNLLGGILIRNKSAAVTVTENQSISNQGPDLILELGLYPPPYSSNTLTPSRSGALRHQVRIDP